MKFGIALQTNLPLATYGPLAAQVEAYGFDTLTVFNDMLYQPAWLPLLEIARATRRLHFGPIAVNPFTCHPINIASQAALLADASQGRFYLGLARGAWLEYVGLNPARPIASLREAYACIRHLLQGKLEPLAGEIYPLLGGERLHWAIEHPEVPFVLATWGLKTVQGCIQHIQAVKVGGTANPAVVSWLRKGIDEAARGIGRDPREIEIIVGTATVVDASDRVACDKARVEVAQFLPIIATLDPSLQIEPEILAGIRAGNANAISDELLRKFALVGNPEAIIAQVQALIEAGAAKVEFAPPHGSLELLGTRVLAGLRA